MITARPTTYNGIPMRSRLEAAYAKFLDARPEYEAGEWAYEPNAFADSTGQYLPDFRISPGHYVEVKPESILTDREGLAAALERMEIIWASEPDAVLGLVVGHDTVRGPRFWTSFTAIGARGDRTWRLTTPSVQIPLIWDRKRQATTGSLREREEAS